MPKSNIISQFKSLDYQHQRELLKQLQQALSASRPILEHREISGCPHCDCKKLYKHSSYKNGGTRFKCTGCRRTFDEFTGTSIHRIHHKAKWDGFICLMLERKTIREICTELGISKQTALDWRHKALPAFNALYTKEFKGIVETDDKYFRFNEKGIKGAMNACKGKKKLRGISNQQVSVMVTMDRYNTIDLKVIKKGRITKDALDKKLNKYRFNQDNIIFSDNSKILKNFFKDMNIKHRTFLAKKKADGEVNVNKVNNFIMRLKRWINHNFNNVSTKYLHNYLNWFMMLEILKKDDTAEDRMWNYLMLTSKGYKNFKDIETNHVLLCQNKF